MQTFLIILAVIVVIIVAILSLKATIHLSYSGGWKTTVKVLFIEKEVNISEVLSFLLFPKEAGEGAQRSKKQENKSQKTVKKQNKESVKSNLPKQVENNNKSYIAKEINSEQKTVIDSAKNEKKPNKKGIESDSGKSTNYVTQVYEKEGIVGIMSVFTTLIETLSSAVTKFFKVFHIHDLYVKMIIGGTDAADIAESYGMVASGYYPLIGMIRNGMKVDSFQEIFFADYLANQSDYEFDFVASLSVKNVLSILTKAGITFLKGYLKG